MMIYELLIDDDFTKYLSSVSSLLIWHRLIWRLMDPLRHLVSSLETMHAREHGL